MSEFPWLAPPAAIATFKALPSNAVEQKVTPAKVEPSAKVTL